MAKLILVGGFLGAGKTTLLLAAAQALTARNLRVGLVTNDQGEQLVDTALAQQAQLPVVEVAGGCFCCRLPDLQAAIHALQNSVDPDVILAEPVGSCTDIMATVMRPLAAKGLSAQPGIQPAPLEIAPFTVLVDPHRLAQEQGAAEYVYRKQLEEAELIGVTKLDAAENEAGQAAMQRLVQRFGPQRVLPLAARTGDGVSDWLARVLAERSSLAQALEIDYATYAEAEAALGWLNARGTVTAGTPFSAQNWLNYLLRFLNDALDETGASIAHIKAQATTAGGMFKAGITYNGQTPVWDLQTGEAATGRLDFVLNARVECSPPVLERAVRGVLAELCPAPDFDYRFTHFSCISPAAPQPSQRILAPA